MKKGWFIAAFIFIAAGAVIMGTVTVLRGLGNSAAQSECVYVTEDFDSVEISALDFEVTVGLTDGESRILYTASTPSRGPRREVKDGTLRIWVPDESFANWTDGIGKRNSVTVLLNYESLKRLSVETASGSVALAGLQADTVAVTTQSGAVRLSSVGADLAFLKTQSGRIAVSECEFRKNLDVQTKSGSIEMTGGTAAIAVASAQSGSISADLLSSSAIYLETKSGSVNVKLVRPLRIETKTGSGSVSVADSARGGEGLLEIHTASGSIRVKAVK